MRDHVAHCLGQSNILRPCGEGVVGIWILGREHRVRVLCTGDQYQAISRAGLKSQVRQRSVNDQPRIERQK